MIYGMFVSDPTLKYRFLECMDTVNFSLKIPVLFMIPLYLSRAYLWPGFDISTCNNWFMIITHLLKHFSLIKCHILYMMKLSNENKLYL